MLARMETRIDEMWNRVETIEDNECAFDIATDNESLQELEERARDPETKKQWVLLYFWLVRSGILA